MSARDLPRVSDLIEPNTRAPLSRVIEEVQKLLGFRGDPEDKAITVGAAMRLGWIDSPPVSAGPGGSGGGGGGGGGGTTTPDLTPPPTATGLHVDGGFSSVIIRWDAATYTTGHGPGQTNIYAVKRDLAALGTLPVFGDANRVATVYGAGNIIALPSELNTRWYVWIKFQSADGVEATAPTGGTNGEQADTGQDVTQLLEILTGEITASQLSTALGNRINLIDGPDTLAGSVAARILAEATARGTAISSEATTRASADSALASSITTLTASVGSNAAAITAEATTRASADSALSSTLSALAATVTSNDAAQTAAVAAEASARATADGALASSITSLSATVTSNQATLSAAITTEASTRASQDTALSSSISTLSASVAGNSAAIAAESSARVSLDGSVSALYTVRAEISAAGRTMVGGFGLSATSTTSAGPRIDFGIRADRFWVSAPSTATGVPDIVPFTILTSPTVEDGVTFPAGIYMDAAYVRNLSALVAKIGVAVIDDAKIGSLSAAKLTAGALAVGQYIRSTGYVAGTAGYNFDGSGNFEINNLVARGTIYASAGTIGGITLGAGYLRSPGYVPGTTGFQLKSDDTADFGSGATFAGTLVAAGGSFIGTLQVGTSPALSGTTMTGNGFLANASGTGVWGTAATNITHDGTRLYLNGQIVTEANLALGSFSTSISGTSTKSGALAAGNHVIGTLTAATPTGGTAPFTYAWSITPLGNDLNNSDYLYLTGTMTNSSVGLSGVLASATPQVVRAGIACVVTDAQGRTCTATRNGFLTRT